MNFTIIQLANCLKRYNLQKIFHTLKKIENGQRTVSDIELKAISDILGIPITTLLT